MMRYKILNLMVQSDLTGSGPVSQEKHLKILKRCKHTQSPSETVPGIPSPQRNWRSRHVQSPLLSMLQAYLVLNIINVARIPSPSNGRCSKHTQSIPIEFETFLLKFFEEKNRIIDYFSRSSSRHLSHLLEALVQFLLS